MGFLVRLSAAADGIVDPKSFWVFPDDIVETSCLPPLPVLLDPITYPMVRPLKPWCSCLM